MSSTFITFEFSFVVYFLTIEKSVQTTKKHSKPIINTEIGAQAWSRATGIRLRRVRREGGAMEGIRIMGQRGGEGEESKCYTGI